MKKIRVSIIGAGNMANEYLKVLSSNKNIELSGIFSRTFAKAELLKKKYKIKKNLVSLKKLYKETKSQIVIATVPGDKILSLCKEMLNFPWVIFIEKPPGINFIEYLKLIKLSKLNKKKIYVGMNRRYFSSTLNLQEKINKIKGPRNIIIFDQQDTNVAKLKGKSLKLIKNWMYANSIHLIDYANFLTRGKLKNIKFIKKNKSEINCFLHFSSEDNVNYICRWNKPGPWQVHLSLKNYYFELSPLEVLKIRSNFKKKSEVFNISRDDRKFKTGLKLQIDDLINVCLGKKNNLPDLGELYKTMHLIKKIYI